MTTRVTCTDPDGGHIFGRPVAHGDTVEVDDEIASVLDPAIWKTATTKTDDEKGKAE